MASVNPRQVIKNNIRSYKRFLAKEDLSEQARSETEAKLLEAENSLKTLADAKKEKEIVKNNKKKYHHIMHIELQKVEKKIKSLTNRLNTAETDEQKQELTEQIGEWEKRLLYIEMYPLHMKYVSLFPKEDTEESITAREKIFSMILGDESAPKNVKESTKIVANIKKRAAEVSEIKKNKLKEQTLDTALKIQQEFYKKSDSKIDEEQLRKALELQKAFISKVDDIDQSSRRKELALDPFFEVVDDNEEKEIETVDFEELAPQSKKWAQNKARTYFIKKAGAQSLREDDM